MRRIFTLLAACLLLTTGVQAGGKISGGLRQPAPPANGAAPAPGADPAAPPAALPDTLVLNPLAVRDPAVDNEEAVTLLVPDGWRTEGGVLWVHHLSTLATMSMAIWNPDGAERVQYFPTVSYTWTEGGIQGFGPGDNYLGNLIMRPLTPGDYVTQVLLPNVRAQVQNARVQARTPMPQVADAIARQVAEPTMQKRVLAERVRVTYEDGGKAYEEDFYAVFSYASSPQMPGSVWWKPERLYAFRAAPGELDERAPLMHVIIASARIKPRWLATYAQVRQQWEANRRQGIIDAVKLAEMVRHSYQQMREINDAATQNHQRAVAEVNRQFTHYIRDVAQYVNPNTGQVVTLPIGYNQVWVSSTGQYIGSNTPGFNPNQTGAGSYTQMQTYTPN